MDNTQIKAKWIEELRSGNHDQVPGTLKGMKPDDTIGYCCLGVLQEKVLGDNLMAVHFDEGIYVDERRIAFYDEGPARVYHSLRDLIGDPLVDSLSQMNDDGTPFGELADYIEEEWEV